MRAVFLNGSLSQNMAKESSDIDFFIITRKNRLWSGRFFSISFVKLLGLKVHGAKVAGRVCLNRYQTEDYLVVHPQDGRNAFHHSFTLPLWQTNHLFNLFKNENDWIKKYRYQFRYQDIKSLSYIILSILPIMIRFIGEVIFEVIFNDFGEKIAKNYQVTKILRNPSTIQSTNDEIFISDKELRFNPVKEK